MPSPDAGFWADMDAGGRRGSPSPNLPSKAKIEDALYIAHDFISRAQKWMGGPDDRNDALSALEDALSALREDS